MADLESPGSPGELYRYRGSDIPWSRPIFQGDVFENVVVPGFDCEPKLAIVVTHACSLREGVKLRPRLLMGIVKQTDNDFSWKGNFRMMFLPELLQDSTKSAFVSEFENIGSVLTESLSFENRVASLSDRGVLLLQQRIAHHFTRYVVETQLLYEQCANVLAEAELLEDWLGAAIKDQNNWAEQYDSVLKQFEEFIKDHLISLRHSSMRAEIRRTVIKEIETRFGNNI